VLRNLIDLFRILISKILKKPVALCDIGDVDGIASAAIFLRKYPNATIILRAPAQVSKSRILRLFTWDFIADLPCPPGSRVKMRADHHRTNQPCAEVECYDPDAPCSAILTAKLLGLENDEHVKKIVSIAIETDTANITSREAKMLDLAVRYSGYRTKLKIIKMLAWRESIDDIFNDYEISEAIRRGLEAEALIDTIVKQLPSREVLTIYFPKSKNFKISYRQLSIKIQKEKGVKFINILVRKGFRTFRLYCGADKESIYDCTPIAKRLGGGGHKFAAGAQYKVSIFKPSTGLEIFLKCLKDILKVDKLELYVVKSSSEIVRLEV